MYKYLFYIYSFLMPIKLGFFFGGASRYIPLRITLVMFTFSILWVLIQKKNIFSKYFFANYAIYLSIASFFVLQWVLNAKDELFLSKYILGFLFPAMIVFNVYVASKLLNVRYLHKGVMIYVVSSLLIIALDTTIRLLYPEYAFKGELLEFEREVSRDSFYIFKYGSIMYLDSNYVALHVLVVIFLISTFRNSYFRRIAFVFSMILLLFSFSRSAYAGIILFYLLSWIYRKRLPARTIMFSTLGMFFLYTVYYLSNNSLDISDISLLSKLDIFQSILLLTTYDWSIALYGIGFDIGGYLYSFREGAYAHALIALLLGEVGLVGSALYFILLSYLFKFESYPISGIIFTMVICGFSLIYPWDSIYVYSLSLLVFKDLKVNHSV